MLMFEGSTPDALSYAQASTVPASTHVQLSPILVQGQFLH